MSAFNIRWGFAVVAAVAVLFSGTAFAEFYVIPFQSGGNSKPVVIVSHTGSDTESGSALLEALTGITDASETNRYLLIIEPGVYDIGSTPLQMKSYVDISGWGEEDTTIKGNVDGGASFPPTSGVVQGANNAELTRLTVKNTGGGTVDKATAVYCNNVSGSFKMTHITAEASGGTYCYGVFNYGSSLAMTNVTAEASGGTKCYGVFNSGSFLAMTNVTATASGGTNCHGVYSNLVGIEITDSDISGDDYSLVPIMCHFTITRTRLDGNIYYLEGTTVCKCVCDENGNCYEDTCPPNE